MPIKCLNCHGVVENTRELIEHREDCADHGEVWVSGGNAQATTIRGP